MSSTQQLVVSSHTLLLYTIIEDSEYVACLPRRDDIPLSAIDFHVSEVGSCAVAVRRGRLYMPVQYIDVPLIALAISWCLRQCCGLNVSALAVSYEL